MDGAPLNYLTAAGSRAFPILWLTWGVIAISVAVMLVIAILVAEGIRRNRQTLAEPTAGVISGENPVRWIYAGVGVSCIVLVAAAAWTLYVLSALAYEVPPDGPTVEVAAHQWWWGMRYLDSDPSKIFSTANEMHIPVGVPVRIVLNSSDVIHSFWVPALGGKTDVIPGQTNTAVIEAEKPGIYLGQCTEYCGQQHAHMGLRVVADKPDDYARWRAEQLQPHAVPPPGSEAARGETAFVTRCGGCHRVRGTLAGGVLGPDLTHLAERGTLAAGSLPNKPAYLSAWILEPQRIKPGTQMPALPLSGPELQAIRTFLEEGS